MLFHFHNKVKEHEYHNYNQNRKWVLLRKTPQFQNHHLELNQHQKLSEHLQIFLVISILNELL
jgi:lipid II:glycine glycyltransferase (peptidoglycan interpeptide bridge formation enzyme)